MAVGQAAVEAGGNFEALIGVGYFAGPVLGIVGRGIGSGGAAAPGREASATVALAWIVTAVACAGAVRPYREARRRRAAGRDALGAAPPER
jgi:hypothetical protein